MLYASYTKLSRELKNSMETYIGQAVLELLIKTIFWLFLIDYLKTTGPT